MKMTEQLLLLVATYCVAAGLSRQRVSTLVFNRGGKVDAIAGGADLNTRSFEAALRWFAANWPADLPWPAGVPRPAVSAALLARADAAEARP